MGRITRSGLNGPPLVRKATAFLLSAIDDRRRVATCRKEGLTFRVSNPTERWRTETLLDKEPDTIAWLEATIEPTSVLYDIGANIGIYSLYAAHLFRGSTRVLAFEPEALNFSRLYQNIFDNGLNDTVAALPIALSKSPGIGRLHLSRMEAGRALHVFDDTGYPNGCAEWSMAHTVDGIVTMLESPWACPSHLKIDVDGPELDVLCGAAVALRAPTLRHVLVELSAASAAECTGLLTDAGFELVSVGQAFDGCANHIFRRTSVQ